MISFFDGKRAALRTAAEVTNWKVEKLTILTGKNSCFTELVQKFIETQSWLLLTFFIYLHKSIKFF